MPAIESTVTIEANDWIVSEGPTTKLLMHWLAHGLLD